MNFHPTESYADLRIAVPDPANYKLVLNTDDKDFSGFGRVAPKMTYPMEKVAIHGREQSIRMYLPNRSAQVLAPK
jgi:1,4-alpha-glucan branching enzyme